MVCMYSVFISREIENTLYRSIRYAENKKINSLKRTNQRIF